MPDASSDVAVDVDSQASNAPSVQKGVKPFRIPKSVETLVVVALFGIAVWTLHHELQSISVQEVISSFRATPAAYIGLSLLFTALNFVALIGYDYFAVRLMKYPLSFKQIATASSLYYAFSNSLGTLLGGTPVRVRLYSGWGMNAAELVRLFVLITVAFWVGMCALAGALFVFSPFTIPARFHIPIQDSRSLGLILLTGTVIYLLLCVFRRTPLHVFSVNLQPPPLKVGLAQVAIGAVDSRVRRRRFMCCCQATSPWTFLHLQLSICSQSSSRWSATYRVDWVCWNWCWSRCWDDRPTIDFLPRCWPIE